MTTQTMIANPRRGCGFLKKGGMYLVGRSSPFGELPAFVRLANEEAWPAAQHRSYIMANLALWSEMRGPQTDPLDDLAVWTGRYNAYLSHRFNIPQLSRSPLDLLMWVGKEFYPTPADFIGEVEKHGLSKRIPFAAPPVIVPGLTRLWIVHPTAIHGETPGLIGYAYVTGCEYVVGDRDRDGVAENWEAVDLCKRVTMCDPASAGAQLSLVPAVEDADNG